VFFGAALDAPDRLGEAVTRAASYLAAGADGIFLPGLVDLADLERVTTEVAAPLNVMLRPGLPRIEQLAAAGVRRISQGGASFLSMIGHLERITNAYLEGEPTELSADTAPAYHLMPQLAYR
jgi:2-methylisocitrate lyase-like PEP mutase family enzyme